MNRNRVAHGLFHKVYVQAELADNGTLFIDSSTVSEEGDF